MPKGVKGFQKGHKRMGGKVQGCKHKINRDIVGLLDSLGCNPIEGLARIATDSKVAIAVRVHAYGRILKHVHPELKSVEISGLGGKPIEIDATTSARERLAARIASLASRTPEE